LALAVVTLALLAEPAEARGKRKRGSRDSARSASRGESDASSSPSQGSSREGAGAYDAILGVDGSYLSKEQTFKTEGYESDPSTSTNLTINFNYLMRVGSLYAGPLLGYSSSQSGSGETKSKTDTLDVGALLDFPFADPKREKVVPHAYAGVRYNTELASGSDDKMSGYRLGLGAGVYYFLNRGIALNPAVEYQMQHLSGGGEYSYTADATIFGFVFGLAAFL
jgi:hypothetical protein